MAARKKVSPAAAQAFPLAYAVGPAGDLYPAELGMTLRDYFAARIVGHTVTQQVGWPNANDMRFHVKLAYALADAMLAERAK